MNRPRCIVWSITPAEGGGFEPPVREPVRQFSKLLVSATHPSFQECFVLETEGLSPQMRVQRYKFLGNFFRKKLFECHHLRQLGIEVEGVLQSVAIAYVAHSQEVEVARRHLAVGDAFLET